ncbi:PD40 domain-containing protein, partial [bacterium]|nr:PD40 domain-containing protein [bacterium]
MLRTALLMLSALALLGCAGEPAGTPIRVVDPEPGEVHFGPLAMLTDGGENAEAYFSYDSKRLVFQTTREGFPCDQIMVMPAGGGNPELLSTGTGRTTCAYFTKGDASVVFSSTHLAGPECPTPPDMSQGYVWGIFGGYDIFKLDMTTRALVRLTDTPGYDAEATIAPDGETIVFTSVRDGDLEIYTMDLNGENVKRLTFTPGYDGGPFFSPDGSKICYRSHHPAEGPARGDYRRLLADEKVRPSVMEIMVMNADGSDQRQITQLGCASFGPFFHPSGEKIIFSSNHPNPRGREFELWMVDLDGGNLEQITHS